MIPWPISSPRRNQSLDLLRGIAILMVRLAHCAFATTSIVPSLAAAAGKLNQFGVQLFFIFSGYTKMLTFGDRVDLAAAGAFYIRRAFRIAPVDLLRIWHTIVRHRAM
jgi:peptidoglycan/LPS O-acetylase OafA/YrhL